MTRKHRKTVKIAIVEHTCSVKCKLLLRRTFQLKNEKKNFFANLQEK